jgi:hypothetical protein
MSLFTFPHVLLLLVAVLLVGLAVYAMASRRADTRRRQSTGHRLQARTSHRGAPKTYRLGGIIAGLITKDTRPPAKVATTLPQDAENGTEALPAPFAAVPCPAPGDPGGYAEYMRQIAELTGTTTGMEQTGQWRAPSPEEIAAAARNAEAAPEPASEVVAAAEPATASEPAPEPEGKPEPEASPEPEPEPALVGAPPMELDEHQEQAMQRFEDAHRDEIAAAGDTTEQDRRGFETGGDL